MTKLTKEKRGIIRGNNGSDNKAKYAQYFTPVAVSDHMVQMFADDCRKQVSILDPGAGEGILGLSLAKRLIGQGLKTSTTLIEVDKQVFQSLKKNASQINNSGSDAVELLNSDFMKESFKLLHNGQRFSHVIMNPPYFKLQRDDEVSDYLMSCGVSVTNMYAAFMWLGLMLLADNGQMVAIVPRSFCNGPYFFRFREYIASNVSIEAIHTFSSRDKVFSKDQVLQENVIIRFVKCSQSEEVTVTYSSDQNSDDVLEASFRVSEIINKDHGLTICVPPYLGTVRLADYAKHSLLELGLEVSTGPVVDFRLKDSIAQEGGRGSVPLLYPAHMKAGQIKWPLNKLPKKGQHYFPQPDLWDNREASLSGDKNVLPADGYYVVIRRFSSKEEKRRIHTAVVDPSICPDGIAFENHLNYFHSKKHGLDKDLAYGLAAYLNSSLLDEHFRTFSGHTQVNATDLRNLPYPSEVQLRGIGRIALSSSTPIESVVTEEVLEVCA